MWLTLLPLRYWRGRRGRTMLRCPRNGNAVCLWGTRFLFSALLWFGARMSALAVLLGLGILVVAAFQLSALAGLAALGASLIVIGLDVPRR